MAEETRRLRLSGSNPYHSNGVMFLVTGSLAGEESARIYNVGGQLIRTILSEPVARTRVELHGDGRSDAGSPMPSGIYFLRARVGSATTERTLLYLR
jgi:hypothetical protein